ncbi:MAG: hypothetical protein KTR31_31140 [Myxococcales bacterium]|nr:hypothetical protein [Myxococcales bacterium]
MQPTFRLAPLTLALLVGCSGADPSATSPTVPDDVRRAFPEGLAVSSPLDVVPAGGLRGATGSYTTHYAWATGRIDQLLAGALSPTEAFTPGLFLLQPVNAGCFGPSMHYHDHPDGPDTPPMGSDPWPSLPSGDLGLWLDVDPNTGDACGAAQLNAQMDGVSSRAVMGLMGVASLIAAADAASVSLPEAGDTIDLVDEMNDLGVADTSFTTATLTLDAAGERWTYELALTFTDTSVHDIALSLRHVPSETDGVYTGVLYWQVDDQFVGGHCPGPDTTYNGSLFYDRQSATEVLLNARDGMYCGHGAMAASTFDTDVDPDERYTLLDPVSDPSSSTGWANNFSIVGAQFDPETLAGSYTYAWQAGPGDGNARPFRAHVAHDEATGLVDGDTYYGFGDRISVTDGTVGGFYCSWAAPGSSRTMQPWVQHQSVVFDPLSARFVVPPSGSHITYAPTNACTYEGTPTGFWYDRDLDRTEDEAKPGDVEVSTKAGSGLQLDLLPVTALSTLTPPPL